MPGPNYYKQLLMKKVFKDRLGDEKTPAHGVDEFTRERYIREIEEETDRLFADENKVKKSVKKLGKNRFRYEEADRRIYGEGIKFAQYKKNRRALLESLMEEVERESTYRIALRKVLKKGATIKEVPNFSWIKPLIKVSNATYDINRNQEVLFLLTLASKQKAFEEKQIAKNDYEPYRDQYSMWRQMHIIQKKDSWGNSKKLEEQKPFKIADEASRNIPKRLLEIYDEVVEETKKDLENSDLQEKAYRVMTGQATEDETKLVYQKLRDPGLYLMWNTSNIIKDLKSLPGTMPEEAELEDRIKRNEEFAGKLQQYMIAIEKNANPYITVLDPYKTAMDFKNARIEKREGDAKQELYDEFISAPDHYDAMVDDLTEETRKYYSLEREHAVRDDEKRDLEFVVYQNPQNKYTAIVRLKHMEDGKILSIDNDINPQECIQRYVNKNIKAESDDFLHTIGKWSETHWTSDNFENMRHALEAVRNKQLSDNPSAAELAELKEKYSELAKKTEVYLTKKNQDKEERHGQYKSKYEKSRVLFAEKLQEFASRKLEELGYAEGYAETLKLEQKLQAEDKNPERKRAYTFDQLNRMKDVMQEEKEKGKEQNPNEKNNQSEKEKEAPADLKAQRTYSFNQLQKMDAMKNNAEEEKKRRNTINFSNKERKVPTLEKNPHK